MYGTNKRTNDLIEENYKTSINISATCVVASEPKFEQEPHASQENMVVSQHAL